jgi:plastocyanin
MHRILLPLTVVAAATAMLVFLMPAGSAADNPTLQASVGPGFTISLKDANGAAVTHLDPGTYNVHVNDLGVEHNFHLSGPGVDQATSVENTEDVTWMVTFTDGAYHFQCDAHASSMKGDFGVGTSSGPPPPPPPAPPPPPSGFAKGTTLKGTVGPGFTISLKDKVRKAVRKVKAGKRYTIRISDKSASHNFHLYGPGDKKKTSVIKKASVTWKLKFKKGKTYRFRCDAHPFMKGSFKAS